MSEKKAGPFSALEALKSSLPAGQASDVRVDEPAPELFEAKVVVARSRKGRGGKTVTIVTGVREKARETICRDLKKALGCGASIEDASIVVQGDVADRVRGWLEAHGAKRIVMGS